MTLASNRGQDKIFSMYRKQTFLLPSLTIKVKVKNYSSYKRAKGSRNSLEHFKKGFLGPGRSACWREGANVVLELALGIELNFGGLSTTPKTRDWFHEGEINTL